MDDIALLQTMIDVSHCAQRNGSPKEQREKGKCVSALRQGIRACALEGPA